MAERTIFGQLADGRTVHRLGLHGGGLACGVLTLGAMVQSLRFAGRDMTLPVPSLSAALADGGYAGATVGRYANRIAQGRCSFGGQLYALDRNEGAHHLHGGSAGTSAQLWSIAGHGPGYAELSLTLPDGHMGYPGRLDLTARFTLRDPGVLAIRYSARSDAPTLCNPAHHSYFTLGAARVQALTLQIAAGTVLPVDAEGLPLGGPVAVADSRFDFRAPRLIEADSALDHNFCTGPARAPLRPVAWLAHPALGVRMTLCSTEPGLQVYDAHKAPRRAVSPGIVTRHCGIALEPQIWPDSPNHPDFPQAWLLPGAEYLQEFEARFALVPKA